MPVFTDVSKPLLMIQCSKKRALARKKSTAALAQQRMVFMVMSLLRNEGM